MKNLTREVLIDLGFEEIHVSIEESGDEPFVYYTLDLPEGGSLITDAAGLPLRGDETFIVNLFDYESLGTCFTDTEVKTLYKALTRIDLEYDNR